jgi:D-aminopeptidase
MKMKKRRARCLGIPFDGTHGTHNAITDVLGVLVGHENVEEGEGPHAARTGVTAILARPVKDGSLEPVFAAAFTHNGVGEMTGTHLIDETGYLISPIVLTNTISVGTAHSAVVKWSLDT